MEDGSASYMYATTRTKISLIIIFDLERQVSTANLQNNFCVALWIKLNYQLQKTNSLAMRKQPFFFLMRIKLDFALNFDSDFYYHFLSQYFFAKALALLSNKNKKNKLITYEMLRKLMIIVVSGT